MAERRTLSIIMCLSVLVFTVGTLEPTELPYYDDASDTISTLYPMEDYRLPGNPSPSTDVHFDISSQSPDSTVWDPIMDELEGDAWGEEEQGRQGRGEEGQGRQGRGEEDQGGKGETEEVVTRETPTSRREEIKALDNREYGNYKTGTEYPGSDQGELNYQRGTKSPTLDVHKDAGTVDPIMLAMDDGDLETSTSASTRITNKQAVVEELLAQSRYTNRIRPDQERDIPTKVEVNMFVNDISSVDEVNMELTMNIFLRQIWRDRRLADARIGSGVTMNYNQFSRLWVPPLYFTNEKRGQFHHLTVPNRLLRLNADGSILYSQRLSLTLVCTMDLKKYPLDNQTCQINLESYGYTTDDVLFEWRDNNPIQMRPGLKLAEYELKDKTTGDCTDTYVTGRFTCIYADFKLERQVEYYLTQTYIPSSLIVILSWVSFWIDMNAVPARISLGLLTVLTMTTQSTGVSQRLPRVSYVKAIDVWMSTCLCFVFGALVEYSIVNVLARKVLSTRRNEARARSFRQSCPTYWGLLKDSVISGSTAAPFSTPNTPTSTTTIEQKVPHSTDQTSFVITEKGSGGEQAGVERRRAGVGAVKSRSTGEITLNVALETSLTTSTSSSSFLDQETANKRPPEVYGGTCAGGPGNDVSLASLDEEDAAHECTCFKSCACHLWKTNKALFVDVFSRVFFPTMFVVFNFTYWISYNWFEMKGTEGF